MANAISKLPIFQYYNIEDNQLYVCIDGQKFETRIQSFKARYSSKYFKDKGVSTVTLSCNHSVLNTTVIGANEYDRLVKANYFRSYLDDQELRRFVQQTLNKGEAYHQLRRKVTSVNSEKLRSGSGIQVELWNDCARLISNCILHYNSAT